MSELTVTSTDKPSAIAERAPMRMGRGVAVDTLPEAVEFAKLMCQAKQGVPKPFRNEPGLCLAVTMQALRWGFDPFGVAQNAYVVNDKVAFEAKVIKAAIDANAGLAEPMDFQYEGKGDQRYCRAIGKFKTERGEIVERFYETPPIGTITPKNSPLWTKDPDQQLAYYAARAWARRFSPGVMLGVYSEDEMRDMGPVINADPPKSLAEQFRASTSPVDEPEVTEPIDLGDVRYADVEAADEPEESVEDEAEEEAIPDEEAEAPVEEVEGPRQIAEALYKVLKAAPHTTAFDESLIAAEEDGRLALIRKDKKVWAGFSKSQIELRQKLESK